MSCPPSFAHLYYDIFYETKKPNLTYVTKKPMPKVAPKAAAKLTKKPSRKYAIDGATKPDDVVPMPPSKTASRESSRRLSS
jgi:hypothetical protein